MVGLFGDCLVDDVLFCCCGDSLEEDLHWEPRLGAFVVLVVFEDGVTNGGTALFKTVEAFSRGAFLFSTSVELKTKGVERFERYLYSGSIFKVTANKVIDLFLVSSCIATSRLVYNGGYI